MEEFIRKIKTALEKYSMLEGKGSVAVAYSGGADSTALLDILYEICTERGIRLEAIHVEHGIRGESSGLDAEHCNRVCKDKGIYLSLVHADVPSLAREWNCGIEEAGRRFRYDTFSRICSERNIDAVATAHHAGDNLETLIFNIARGSGLRGICGIPPVRGNIIRPLILCTRGDIENYCRERGLGFVTDETNASDEYTRNYIRHTIIPAIERLNLAACEAAARMSVLLREDEAYLTSEAAKYAGSCVKELADLPDPILTRALYARLPDGIKPGGINITAAVSAVRNGINTRISVGSHTALVLRDCSVYFTYDDRQGKKKTADYELVLTEDRMTAVPGTKNEVLFTRDSAVLSKIANVHKKSIKTSLNYAKIKGNIYIRPRRPGDKLRVRGMNHTVKNLMQEKGIGVQERRKLPCFCDEDGIVWIPGLPLRDGLAGDEAYIVFSEREDIK